MGSGANAFSYLVQRGDYLIDAPLTYYSRIHIGHVARLRNGRYRIQPSGTGSMRMLLTKARAAPIP